MPSDDKLQNFKHAQLLFFNARNGIYHSSKKLVEYFIKLIYKKREPVKSANSNFKSNHH